MLSRMLIVAALSVLCSAACGSQPAGPSSNPSPSATGSVHTFKLDGVRNPASGTVVVTAGSGTVTLELKVAGLQPDSSHVAHIHVGSCQQRGGIAFALNQVVADAQGNSDSRTTLGLTFPPAQGTWYVVVHAGPDMQGPASASYLLCGNLFT